MANHSHDGEVLDAHMTAHLVALLALVRCLEENGALRPGQYADALHMAMESGRRNLSDMTLAMLHGIREAALA